MMRVEEDRYHIRYIIGNLSKRSGVHGAEHFWEKRQVVSMSKDSSQRDAEPVTSEQWSRLETAGVIDTAFDTDELAEGRPEQANGALVPVGAPEQTIDEEAIKTAVVMMLKAIGEDPTREGLRD